MTLIPEDTKPDYDAEPPVEYIVTLPDGTTTTTTDAEWAETCSRNGARVTARKGWGDE